MADSLLLSTTHDRQRREERGVLKIDLQNARRYGIEESSYKGRIKLTFGGVVFIYDPKTGRSITSFVSKDLCSNTSGTKVTLPVILKTKDEYYTARHKERYDLLRTSMLTNKHSWNSHSVLVVDMSGSMRRDDVNGARCRSDGVWIALARDFVEQQLKSNQVNSFDLVSVILMGETSDTVLSCYPMDWCLYNEFVSMREWKTVRPSGPGNYMPALVEAERLLDINNSGKCSLSLMFFSDGKPSDCGNFVARMGEIASKFGRRLTVSCIGMSTDEDFTVLKSMAKEAENFGATAVFNRPNLSLVSLSSIITSLATSLAESKTEMTDLKSGKMRCVRTDIRRESRTAPEDFHLTDDWRVFHNKDLLRYVVNVWTWKFGSNFQDFVAVMDPRCFACYTTVAPNTNLEPDTKIGVICPTCKACFACHECKAKLSFHMISKECKDFLKNRRLGTIVKHPIPSFSLAVKKMAFGEGAERVVYKARFLDESRNFFGQKMVAKESRFLTTDDYDNRMDFHADFLRTQFTASEFAEKFNSALDRLEDHFPDGVTALRRVPRIRFLKPFVVECYDEEKDEEWNILVEEQLEGTYKKFNSNKGYVRDGLLPGQGESKQQSSSNEGSNGESAKVVVKDLGVIEEGSEEEDSSDESDDDIIDSSATVPDGDSFNLTPEQVPQCFSHFTYVKCKRMMMVVDLQGVLQKRPDGLEEYALTDPAIHKRKKNKRSTRFASWTFGRTDRGESGMRAFIETHKCNDMCRILGLEDLEIKKTEGARNTD